ncbi:MAG: hypothetical protein QOE01_108 [Actinomycetota bacterium]|nr:hypothetical protein [Actinomycetota bacterium]
MPDEVRDGLDLTPGECVLSAASLEDGSWLVATDRALLADGNRISWAATTHAEWDADSRLLTVDELVGSHRHRFVLDEPGFLPETVRERVMASIVLSRHVRVGDRGGARFVARREQDSDELDWQVVVDAGLDPSDAEVRAALDARMRELRHELGE